MISYKIIKHTTVKQNLRLSLSTCQYRFLKCANSYNFFYFRGLIVTISTLLDVNSSMTH